MPIEWVAIAKAKMTDCTALDAAQAIWALLASGSEYEPWLHRDLLLAGWCLTQAPIGVKEVDARLVHEILDRLVAIAGDNRFQCGRHVQQQVKEILCRLDTDTFGMMVLDRLKALGDAVSRSHHIEYQIRLGEIASGSASLLQLLLNEGMLSDRLAAIDLWVRLKKIDAVSGNPLLTLLQDEKSPMRQDVIQALGELDDPAPEVVNALFAVFEQYISFDPRRYADEMMMQDVSNAPTEFLRQAMAAVREKDPLPDLGYVTWALIKLSQINPTILDKLIDLARHPDWRIRKYIADWSGDAPQIASSQLIQALIDLADDENSIVRSCAVSSLRYFINDSPLIAPKLLALIGDNDKDVRSAAIYALAKLNHRSIDVIDRLLLLAQDTDWEVRDCAAMVLGEIGQNDSRVTDQLLVLMQDSEHDVACTTIEALAELKDDSPQVIAALIERLDHSQNWQCTLAASALGEIGCSTPEVIEALKSKLHTNGATASALIKLGYSSLEVATEVIDFLEHESFSWRERYADELGPIGKQSEEIPYLLNQWLAQHPDGEAVRDAIDALWSIVVE
jgi:HEAT repeat protein